MIEEASTLRTFLGEAEWTPRDLARAVNRWLETRGRSGEVIHPTTPYQWVRHDFCPYEPHPGVVAEVFSQRLGRRVTVEMLWPKKGQTSARSSSLSDVGLARQSRTEAVLDELERLVNAGDPDRAGLFTACGPELVAPAVSGLVPLPHTPESIGAIPDGDWVPPPLVDLICSHIASLRRMDDRTGGGTVSLRYVQGVLRGVLDLVRYSSYEARVGQGLLIAGRQPFAAQRMDAL